MINNIVTINKIAALAINFSRAHHALDTVILETTSGGSDDSILRFPDENKVRVGQGTDVG
jgi:hypothetical protein